MTPRFVTIAIPMPQRVERDGKNVTLAYENVDHAHETFRALLRADVQAKLQPAPHMSLYHWRGALADTE